MAKSSDVIIEKLIEMVRNYPSLYNPRDPRYKDAQLSKNIWDSIGKKLGISGTEAKRKWWSKKDNFTRLRNAKPKSGQAADTKLKSWKWYKYLEFLVPYIHEANTESNMPSDEDSDHSEMSFASTVPERSFQATPEPRSPSPPISERSHHSESTVVTVPETILYGDKETSLPSAEKVTSIGRRKHKRKMTETKEDKVGEAVVELVKQRKLEMEHRPVVTTTEKKDPDDLFFEACLGQFKELPKRVRAETKLEIMNLLNRKQFGCTFQTQSHTMATERSFSQSSESGQQLPVTSATHVSSFVQDTQSGSNLMVGKPFTQSSTSTTANLDVAAQSTSYVQSLSDNTPESWDSSYMGFLSFSNK